VRCSGSLLRREPATIGQDDRRETTMTLFTRSSTTTLTRFRLPENGTARILQDEVGSAYDRVGGPSSNYQP